MEYCRISLKKVPPGSKYPGYLNPEFKKFFNSLKVNPVLSFSRKDFFRESPLKSKGMSISGIQHKLSLKVDSQYQLQMTEQDGTYILKPSPEAFPHAAENEHCAMLSGMLLKIPTAPCALISFSDGEPVYITKRFDRREDQRIHQEDLVQGFGIKSDDKYSRSYEEAGRLIHAMVNGKAAVVMDFFKRVVHAYIIGNDDMHLKNISLQKQPGTRGIYYDHLTPNYDCLSTHAFESMSGSEFLALDLLESEKEGFFSEAYTRYGFYTASDFRLFGGRIGLREKPVIKFIEFARKKEPDFIDLVKQSYMPVGMKKNVCRVVSERIKALGYLN
ncbi:type II toxin-antitoxin system HipA family toxin [Desulfobacter latus]|uniref:HipA domain-containing protein n=1 Tax=Desulfobacter latus TaxID=2292 RepID=A0A850T6Q6_9BACT|nr:HipA domain-containing protein [Desulfobacter latus]NWH06781.1 HipA domain-containing protein [Desulfobacter latus]